MQTTNCESLVAFPLDEITSFDLSVSPGGVRTQYQTVMETLSSGQLKISGASFSTTHVRVFIYLSGRISVFHSDDWLHVAHTDRK